MDGSVTPVAQPIRRIPFSRREKVVKKLKELEHLDVIEKVNGPTQWVNPVVTVKKPNGDVRVCLDMREANKAIIRERQPIPTVEETVQEMGEMKVFTKLDLNMAFHQVELHPESRDITTFAAPNGLYRYKRLVFGLNMASEKFNHATRQVVQDCPGPFNIHDDLIVGGVDDVEHDERVVAVVRKFAESGLTFNFENTKGVPYWPQSNGEVESFNETMMKAIKIAKIEKKHWKEELQNFLFQYRTTPHTVTGVSPAEMLMGQKLRNELPKMQMRAEPMDELQWQMQIRERDARRKRYEKEYADKKRGAKVSDIEVGDRVILRQSKRNKLTTPFEREPY